jgi:hypothetical protein
MIGPWAFARTCPGCGRPPGTIACSDRWASISQPPRKLLASVFSGNTTSTSKLSPTSITGGTAARIKTSAFFGSRRTSLGFGTPRLRMSFSSIVRYIDGGGSPPVPSRFVTSPTDSIVIGCRPETVTWSFTNCVSGGLTSSSSGFCDRRLSFWQPLKASVSIQHKN